MNVDVHPLFVGLCDDAAVFPPGNAPLADAVPAYARHLGSAYASVVGPFVLAAKDLDLLAQLVAGLEPGSFRLSLTVPLPKLAAAVAYVDEIAPVRLEALEVALLDDVVAAQVVPALDRALAGRRVPVFVELPRDARRPEIVEAMSGTGLMAKLRTGGVRADLYPDEKELAAAVGSLAAAGVPFKATAGLHHALRNTDPETSSSSTDSSTCSPPPAPHSTAPTPTEACDLLADRDGTRVADRVRGLSARASGHAFRSFGTCSSPSPSRSSPRSACSTPS